MKGILVLCMFSVSFAEIDQNIPSGVSTVGLSEVINVTPFMYYITYTKKSVLLNGCYFVKQQA